MFDKLPVALGELTTHQLIKKLAADTIFKKKYGQAVAKVKEIMFKHGDKPRHGKEYYAGKIANQFGLDPHVLAIMIDEQLSEGSESFKQHFDIMEGVNDPSIFKAVFLAGGPGSGKSFVVGKTALQALGFRLINSDDAFEKGLKKAGLTTDPKDIASAQGQAVRASAKSLTGKQMKLALNGRLGLVIDGTGKDYGKIRKQVDMLRTIGYAVHMIFVNTDLDTALERNKMRPRSLPDDMVTKMWKGVQKNIGKFQGLFRNRMIIIDNSKGSDIEASTLEAYKDIKTWAAKSPENAIALKWIKGQKK
jgi:predicted kinase